MQYQILASDYDGTLAQNGVVTTSTLAAVESLQASGRRFVLVTGRELPDLKTTFPEFGICDAIVAENGAVVYWPAEDREEVFGEPVPLAFIEKAKELGVNPYSTGKVIFATWQPYEQTILEIIREMGLERQIIFNKGAVMVLPSGLNKSKGLAEVLKRWKISADHVVGVGDAENDHAFLEICSVSAVVANGLSALKTRCDVILERDHGAGVEELIDRIVSSDLQSLGPRHPRISMTVPVSVQQ